MTGKLKNPSRMKFGETPFDNLTREQLLLLLLKHQMAMDRLLGVVSYWKHLSGEHAETNQPYWSELGLGGHALAIAREVMGIYAKTEAQRSSLFRKFFRYASSIMFPNQRRGMSPWMKCSKCDQLVTTMKSSSNDPKCFCGGELSPFTMKDLRPDLDVEAAYMLEGMRK